MNAFFTKATILKDLKTIYLGALKAGDWRVALEVTKLRGRHIGLFDKQRLPEVSRIADMTEEQLTEFIDRLEQQEPSLKDQQREPSGEDQAMEKERDGKVTALDAPNLQEAASEGERENSVDPAAFVSLTHDGLPKRRQESMDNLYFREGNSAEDAVLPSPNPEWEKPPPIPNSGF